MGQGSSQNGSSDRQTEWCSNTTATPTTGRLGTATTPKTDRPGVCQMPGERRDTTTRICTEEEMRPNAIGTPDGKVYYMPNVQND